MDALSTQDMIQAQRVLFHHFLSFVKSMALKCAVDLGIPNAIHSCGGSATLIDIVAGTGVHTSKLPYVQRIMNLLTISGVFASSNPPVTGICTNASPSVEAMVYKLTPSSRVLVDTDNTSSMSAMVKFVVCPTTVTPFFGLHAWLKDEKATNNSFFEMMHGCTRWELMAKDDEQNALFNNAMVGASNLSMNIILRDVGDKIFDNLGSLVDVGGGLGLTGAAITSVFPRIKCTVLDLPHVVGQATGTDRVQFVPGDMFKFIPKADAVLLKWILHAFDDDNCVKILCRCKEAIPTREAGGKVIIIDAVMGTTPGMQDTSMEMLALYDLYMMHVNGVERDEPSWEKIFLQAGFSAYKIVSVVAMSSVIEVYP